MSSNSNNPAPSRLAQIYDSLNGSKTAGATLPWDPNSTQFPTRHNLPPIKDAPEQAAWVWGKDDFLGRLNLLTPTRVKEASKEIKTGEIIPVNLPLHMPNPPSFGRETFKHTIKELYHGVSYDDLYELNTQSGSQWDGFRHFSHIPTLTFYNGTKAEDIVGDKKNLKSSVHHWARHGIAARGVLLDYWSYAQANGITYDPYTAGSPGREGYRFCGRAAERGHARLAARLLLCCRCGRRAEL